MAKKEIKVNGSECDFCKKNDVENPIEIKPCYICGKDFCPDCGTTFSGKYQDFYTVFNICKSCLKKLENKAEKILKDRKNG